MSIFDGQLCIQAAAASGTEAVLKRELASLGYSPRGAEYGRICFEGTMRDVARANVFCRTAGRVRIVVAEFEARTFDELFERTREIRWQDVVPRDGALVVTAKSIKSKLFSLSDIQSIVKKAAATALCEAYSVPRLAETGATYSVEAAVVNDKVTLALDTSGAGLHKRGYRVYLGEAPIRETLAASIIMLSVWNRDRAFADPFCGSGTLPIEAALIATDTAPGLNRSFAFEEFANAPEVVSSVREEARALINRSAKLRIRGSDVNPAAVKLAMKHAERAGVADMIHLQVADMRTFSSRYAHGVVVTNPPYGERLMIEDELKVLYRDFGETFSRLDEWSAYVITSYRAFEKYFGRRADKVRRLYNSELECNLYTFLGAPPAKTRAPYAEQDKNEVFADAVTCADDKGEI